MNETSTLPISAPSRAERNALRLAMFGAAMGAITVAMRLVKRIVEVLSNSNVPVSIPLDRVTANLPLGRGGTNLALSLDHARLYFSDLSGITLSSLILSELVSAVAAVTLIAIVVLFYRNVIAGGTFGGANSALALWASGALICSEVLRAIFTSIGVKGALDSLGGTSAANWTFDLDFAPLLAGGVVAAISAAFIRGERMQRDTEGLV